MSTWGPPDRLSQLLPSSASACLPRTWRTGTLETSFKAIVYFLLPFARLSISASQCSTVMWHCFVKVLMWGLYAMHASVKSLNDHVVATQLPQ